VCCRMSKVTRNTQGISTQPASTLLYDCNSTAAIKAKYFIYSTMTAKSFVFVLLATAYFCGSEGFVVQQAAPSSLILLHEATGGWGIGQSREISPEEFAKGDRRAFTGYEMTDRGDFLRNVKQEKDQMMKSELEELLNVSKFAGIKVKDPKERLDKFEPEVLEDDEDIDLSV
jgi:hypothetical protein